MDVNSLVLFNRYYRPDIDIDNLRVVAQNVISSPHEITLSLRWIALLYGKINTELVAATGIHDYQGVIKQILAGKRGSGLFNPVQNGIAYLGTLLDDIRKWMSQKGYENLSSFRGLLPE